MAVDQLTHVRRALPGLGWLSWAVYHLLSLETLLVLFLHARSLKDIFPATPVPETVFYGALSIAVSVPLIFRDGVYLRGIPIVIAGLVFTGWVVAAYGWTADTALARENLPFILGVNLWALFVGACVVAGSRERVLRFLLLLVLLTAGLAFMGAYIEVVHGSFRFYRGSGGDWNPRAYLGWGYIVSGGAAIALVIAVHTRFGSAKQLAAAAIVFVSFFFVMTSGARGAALGIMVAGLLMFLVTAPRIRDGHIEMAKAQLVLLALLALLFGYLGYLLTTGQTTSTLGRLLRLFDEVDDALLRRGPNRFDYFAAAYRAWLAAPLFGQGLYGFSYFFCGPGAYGCYPHNAILHVLADFGLIGLVLFLLFCFTGMRHLGLARLRTDPLMLTLAVAFVTVVVNVMVASDTTTNFQFFFFLGLLALRQAPDDDDEKDDDDDDDERADYAA